MVANRADLPVEEYALKYKMNSITRVTKRLQNFQFLHNKLTSLGLKIIQRVIDGLTNLNYISKNKFKPHIYFKINKIVLLMIIIKLITNLFSNLHNSAVNCVDY